MPKRYRSRKSFRSRRGRRSPYRKMKRSRFQSRVKRVLMTSSETKYYDVGGENLQLYHNTGRNGAAYCRPMIWNPWATMALGTSRYNRIGDKITPLGMKIRLWLSNKLDRPNVSYRIVACIFPRLLDGVAVTDGSVDPAPTPQAGTCGNYSIVPWDKEKGIKVLYDKLIRNPTPWGGVAPQKECSRTLKIYLKRKSSRPIHYNSAGNIINNPFALYVIPYDAYGTLTTDNIASMAYTYRMYYKDV